MISEEPSTRFADLDAAAWTLPADVLERTPTPALVVYLDRVRENVRRVLAHTDGPERWRPHIKTAKIPEVFAELARAGLRNFKCATTREARHLLATLRDEGVPEADVLLAHPLRGPGLARLGEIAREHPGARVSVLCEDPALIPEIPPALSVFVDVNPGMHRTGLPLAEDEAIEAVARAAGERFRGVHYYDGHLHAEPVERQREAFACYDGLVALVAALASRGIACGELVTSGTPTFLHALAYPDFPAGVIQRVSPGTVVYNDLRTERENPALDLLPAALVLTRVVSHPRAGTVTCDAGSKSIAAEAGDPCAFVLGHPELVARTPNEEHLPLEVTRGELPARGATLLLVPLHVCPTVNLAEEALLVEAGRTRIVAVSARAHDLA